MSNSIVVVGSYVQDLTFYADDFPSPGETVLGTFASGPGGKGSNQAIAARRAGAQTTFIGALGQDAFAQIAKDFHENEGVNAQFLEVPNISTGAASIVVNKNGENEIVVSLGACNHLKSEDVQARFIENPQVVVTQLETDLEATVTAMKLGKDANALTVLNSAPMRADFDKRLLENVDVLIPNESEFVSILNAIRPTDKAGYKEEDILNMEAKDLHEVCRSIGVRVVVLTLGARGAFLSSEGRYRAFLPLSDLEVIDTTGAGDAFVGGFAAGWVRFGQDLDAAIQYGIVVSGLSVTRKGTAPAMPNISEINRKLELYSIR